jgi:hypothetical protein
MVIPKDSWPAGAEQRLKGLGIQLPSAPTPFGSYVETVQTGNLLFLSGMLPVVDRKPKFIGRSEDVQRRNVGGISSSLGIELFPKAARDPGLVEEIS